MFAYERQNQFTADDQYELDDLLDRSPFNPKKYPEGLRFSKEDWNEFIFERVKELREQKRRAEFYTRLASHEEKKKKSKIVNEYNTDDEDNIVVPKKASPAKPPKFVKKSSAYTGECGIRNGKIYIPLCQMGGGGLIAPIDNPIHYHPIPKKMDLEWFETIATHFKKYPYFDFNAHTLQTNIIHPNLPKIFADCGVVSERVKTRIEEQTPTFLCRWFKTEKEDPEDEDEDPNTLPNKNTFLADRDLDF
jgi:hypothetical protein